MKLSKEIYIGDYKIGENSPTYIIAEIGTNHHHGDMEIIKTMVKEAKNSGANAVKFQTYDVKNNYKNCKIHSLVILY